MPNPEPTGCKSKDSKTLRGARSFFLSLRVVFLAPPSSSSSPSKQLLIQHLQYAMGSKPDDEYVRGRPLPLVGDGHVKLRVVSL